MMAPPNAYSWTPQMGYTGNSGASGCQGQTRLSRQARLALLLRTVKDLHLSRCLQLQECNCGTAPNTSCNYRRLQRYRCSIRAQARASLQSAADCAAQGET